MQEAKSNMHETIFRYTKLDVMSQEIFNAKLNMMS